MIDPVKDLAVERSGVVAAALGALFPGLGHVYLARWGRAAIVALPALALGVLLVSALRMPRLDLLGVLVSSEALLALLVANIVLLAWRLLAVLDPYRISGSERSAWTVVTVLLLAFLVSLPHAVIARYTLDASRALDQVFVAGDVTPITPLDEQAVVGGDLPMADPVLFEVLDPATRPLPFAPPRTPRSLLFTKGVGDPDAIGVPARRSDPVKRELGTLLGSDYYGVSRLTILLVGSDGGPGRSGNRSDSIMVVTFDTETGKSAVFGIPRNMTHLPLPTEWSTAFTDLEKRLTPFQVRKNWTDDDGDGEPDQFESCHCFPDQINALYPYTRKWTDTYPDEVDPGLAALRDTVQILLGLEIDYYVMVDMAGFVSLVDALGGVRAHVAQHVQTEVSPAVEGEEWIEIDLEPGWHLLNGVEALAYVRERKSVSDYTRMQRQRCLLKAVAAQADPVTLLRNFSNISRAIASAVRTDIPRELLPALLRHGSSLDTRDIVTIGFVPPFYASVYDSRGKPTPNLLRIQAMVRWALSAQEDTDFTTGRESEC